VSLLALIVIITFGFSVLLSFLSLFYAVIKLSWKAMLVCFIASLPISIYFLSGNPPISFIGLMPLLFLILTVYFRMRSQKEII
jgi:hypothetical protein